MGLELSKEASLVREYLSLMKLYGVTDLKVGDFVASMPLAAADSPGMEDPDGATVLNGSLGFKKQRE